MIARAIFVLGRDIARSRIVICYQSKDNDELNIVLKQYLNRWYGGCMKKPKDDFIEIEEFKKGDRCYHYTSLLGFKGICDNSAFFASLSDFLNDPNEMTVANTVFRDSIKNMIEDKAVAAWVINMVDEEDRRLNYFHVKSGESVCSNSVVSFSLSRDDANLWSSFTNNSGVCLEYDMEELYESFNVDCLMHGAVVYDKLKQRQLIDNYLGKFDVIHCLKTKCEISQLDNNQVEEVKSIAWGLSIYNMFFKNEYFQGEKEYRFVLMDSELNSVDCEKGVEYRLNDNFFLPYVRIKIDSFRPLKSIILGPNIRPLEGKSIKLFCQSLSLDVDVQQSSIILQR